MKRKCIFNVTLSCVILAYLCSCARSAEWVTLPDHGGHMQQTFKRDESILQPSMRKDGDIAPGYVIAIKSPDPKVSGEYRVSINSTLRLPYNVRINTNGLDESQLRQAIRNSYGEYFRNPSDIEVNVVKKEYLVDAHGLIQKPGQYVIQPNSSLDEVIAVAGGLQESLSGSGNKVKYVLISNGQDEQLIRLADYYAGTSRPDLHWRGGEKVFFQTEAAHHIKNTKSAGSLVHVLGEVENPSDYAYDGQADFFKYLVKAGGPTDRADLNNITLIRSTQDQTRALRFSSVELQQIPSIQPGDTLIFNAENPSALEKDSRIASQFASIISSIGIVVIAAMP